jgi:hypothetical protein
MKFRDVGLSLLGASLVYVTMAACNGGAPSSQQAQNGGKSGSHGGIVDTIGNPVPPAAADPQNGTRLKATFRTADDGSKEYIAGSWFDTQTQENCSFLLASDGKQRCLPEGAPASTYSDAACSTPVIAVATGCTSPKYAITASASTCDAAGAGLHVFPVGAETTPTSLYINTGSSCFSLGPPTTGMSYYAVGAEIAASSFLAANTSHD